MLRQAPSPLARRLPRLLLKLVLAGLALVLIPMDVQAAAASSSLVQPADTSRRVLGLLLATGAFGAWAEENTKIGSTISGVMVTFFVAMGMSSLGWIPTASENPVYTGT